MKNQKLDVMIKISLLSAIAFVFMLWEFPIPSLFPAFLKFDVSDLPALLGGFALGPVAGITVELMKNVLHVAIKGTESALIGELANFMVGSIMVYVSAVIYKRNKSRRNAVIGLASGSVAMSLGAALLNLVLFLPLYSIILHFNMDNIANYIVAAIIPFNLLKAAALSVITFVIYKGISPILHKEVDYRNKKEIKEI